MSRRVTLNLGFQKSLRDVTIVIPDDEPTPWQWGERLSIVGTPTPRVDGPMKATGAARYTCDINLLGMLYGAILRSPLPHARIRSLISQQRRESRGCGQWWLSTIERFASLDRKSWRSPR